MRNSSSRLPAASKFRGVCVILSFELLPLPSEASRPDKKTATCACHELKGEGGAVDENEISSGKFSFDTFCVDARVIPSQRGVLGIPTIALPRYDRERAPCRIDGNSRCDWNERSNGCANAGRGIRKAGAGKKV